jgi:hypothetical protein
MASYDSDSDCDSEGEYLPWEWQSKYMDDIMKSYDEARELFDQGGHPVMRNVTSAEFGDLCEGIWNDDRTRPFDARCTTVPPYLELPDNGGFPDYDVPVSHRAEQSFDKWCQLHRNVIRTSYAMVVGPLLDKSRGFTDGYLERWAWFLYGNKRSRPPGDTPPL